MAIEISILPQWQLKFPCCYNVNKKTPCCLTCNRKYHVVTIDCNQEYRLTTAVSKTLHCHSGNRKHHATCNRKYHVDTKECSSHKYFSFRNGPTAIYNGMLPNMRVHHQFFCHRKGFGSQMSLYMTSK